MKCHLRQPQRGFTFVELLIALLLVALLCWLLMGGLGLLTERAKASKCIANLRQIGGLITLYANDHQGEMPPATRDQATRIWYRELYPYLGIVTTAAGQSIFACPSKTAEEGTGHSYAIDYAATVGGGAIPPPIRFAALKNNATLSDPTLGERWLVMDARWYFIRAGSGSASPAEAPRFRHAQRANVLMADLSVLPLRREQINTRLYLFRTNPIP